MPQLSYPLDKDMYTAEYPQLWLSTRTSGVFSSDDLQVKVSLDSVMTVEVGEGIAWLSFNKYKGAVFANTTPLKVMLELADGVLNRIDRIVVRWDNIQNHIMIYKKQGELSDNPVPPNVQRDNDAHEIVLADIYIGAGTLTLTQSNISDLRLNETLCGIMRDGVTGIPTQTLYDQWLSWFTQLKQNANQQAEDFGNWLTNYEVQSQEEFELQLDAQQEEFDNKMTEWTQEAPAHQYLSTVTLKASNWLGNVAPFTQSIDLIDMKAIYEPMAYVLFNENLEQKKIEQKNGGFINQVDSLDGKIKFTCFDKIPEIDLKIRVKAVI